jgi:hypothetical protein
MLFSRWGRIMLLRILCSVLALIFASISSSHANIITVTYSGGASGIRSDPITNTVVGFNVGATETYIFDTGLGPTVITPVGFELHGWVSSTMTLDGIGTFSAGPNYFANENGVINMYPLADPFSRMYVVYGQGTFQFGTCPGSRPCGIFGASSITVAGFVAPVPGPIIGTGLPGLLLAVAGFIGWRRSRRAL